MSKFGDQTVREANWSDFKKRREIFNLFTRIENFSPKKNKLKPCANAHCACHKINVK